MPPLARLLVRFYEKLDPPIVPKGFEVIHPQPNPAVMKVVNQFFKKYYSDRRTRKLILGINPGRYGAGITGINFTAPRQLKDYCKIDHPWTNTSELSAEFIYEMIARYGGPSRFYSDYFIGAVCPLGFLKDGKNVNYYDDAGLCTAVTPFIIESIERQLQMGFQRDTCICIGGEKNFRFLEKLNREHRFFDHIRPLSHPRFIMQYQRKNREEFLCEYLSFLQE